MWSGQQTVTSAWLTITTVDLVCAAPGLFTLKEMERYLLKPGLN
jgi:hypothetical protein